MVPIPKFFLLKFITMQFIYYRSDPMMSKNPNRVTIFYQNEKVELLCKCRHRKVEHNMKKNSIFCIFSVVLKFNLRLGKLVVKKTSAIWTKLFVKVYDYPKNANYVSCCLPNYKQKTLIKQSTLIYSSSNKQFKAKIVNAHGNFQISNVSN